MQLQPSLQKYAQSFVSSIIQETWKLKEADPSVTVLCPLQPRPFFFLYSSLLSGLQVSSRYPCGEPGLMMYRIETDRDRHWPEVHTATTACYSHTEGFL